MIYRSDEELLRKLNVDKTLNKPLVELTEDYVKNLKFRFEKTAAQKKSRSKSKAEVFTPTWLCNLMNNHADELWFGRADVFNTTSDGGKKWISTTGKVTFGSGKGWQDYALSKRLEITCGEAPFIVSRYDSVTGAKIPLGERIGLLDRKLRIVNENCARRNWQEWAVKAYQSTYAYEYQLDNILLARLNLTKSYADYHKMKFGSEPTEDEFAEIIEVVNWNVFNMDGLKDTVPGTDVTPKVMDWSSNAAVEFTEIKK